MNSKRSSVPHWVRSLPVGCARLLPVALAGSSLAQPYYRAAVEGDCNCDGVVDAGGVDDDLAIVLGNMGSQGRVTALDGDVNRDRIVDVHDLFMVLAGARSGVAADPSRVIQGIDLDASYNPVTNTVVVTDLDTGATLVDGVRPIWAPAASGDLPPGVLSLDAADVVVDEFTPTSDGFDMKVVMTNPHAEPRALGVLQIPGLRFDGSCNSTPCNIWWRNFDSGGSEAAFGSQNSTTATFLRRYPGNWYAPAQVLRTDTGYTIGVSIQYPVLDYQHSIMMQAVRIGFPGTGLGWRWEMRFGLNDYKTGNNGNSHYNADALLQPGDSRTYDVTVRIMKDSEYAGEGAAWMRLLDPYVRYFRCVYGGVRHVRDERPIHFQNIADGGLVGASNPYGYKYASSRSPYHFGWGPWVNYFESAADNGWGRVVVWLPTGAYDDDGYGHSNFPPQFTSQWSQMPNVDPAVLAAFGNGADRSVGLWWGRAAQYADA